MDYLQSFSKPSLLKQLSFFTFFFTVGALSAQDLPEAFHDASVLELQGHYTEALEAYQKVLALEPQGSSSLARSKAAFLALDLGRIDQAWELADPLLNSDKDSVRQTGFLVRMRCLRLQGKPQESWNLFKQLEGRTPKSEISATIYTEALLSLKELPRNESAEKVRIEKLRGKAALGGEVLILQGNAEPLPLPEAIEKEGSSQKIQLGVFRNEENANAVLASLRKEGWSPFVETRKDAGFSLFLILLWSTDPTRDLRLLKAEGFDAFFVGS